MAKTPGFTADSSLDKTARDIWYRTGIGRKYEQGTHTIRPALSVYVDGLYYCEGYIDIFGNVRCFSRFDRFALLL